MKRSVCHLLGVLAASAAVALPASAITIDGDFSDWTNVPVIATDPADNAGSIDLRTLQVHLVRHVEGGRVADVVALRLEGGAEDGHLAPGDRPAADLAGQVDQEGVDRLLRNLVEFRQLADVDPAHVRGHQRHDLGRDQAVMHDHIGGLDQPQCLQRQQFRITGACTDKVDRTRKERAAVVFHGSRVPMA